MSPDGTKVYVANSGSDNVSVIDSASGTVTPIPVGRGPVAFGLFIQPAKFVGTPGTAQCIGTSTTALIQKYGTLAAAAKALGFKNPGALQTAIRSFCQG